MNFDNANHIRKKNSQYQASFIQENLKSTDKPRLVQRSREPRMRKQCVPGAPSSFGAPGNEATIQLDRQAESKITMSLHQGRS